MTLKLLQNANQALEHEQVDVKIDSTWNEATLNFKPWKEVKLILVDPIPNHVKREESRENEKRKKRKRLIFLAKKMHAASNGGTFLTGCNIAEEKYMEE